MIAWLLAAALAADSPHGAPDGCPACHLATDAGVGPARPATPTCLGCHPTADMHPVGVSPVTTRVPDGWPLEDGRVTCATCHVEPAHPGVDPALLSPWHRQGPYPRTLDLCARCHDLADYVRVDPHHATDATPRAEGGCAACHTSSPAPGAPLAEARLRTAPDKVCALCHEGPVHHGVEAHLGRPAPAGLPWPTGPDGAIACFTCHEVHGGVDGAHGASALARQLRERAGLPPAPEASDHPGLLQAPLDPLCATCHGVGP